MKNYLLNMKFLMACTVILLSISTAGKAQESDDKSDDSRNWKKGEFGIRFMPTFSGLTLNTGNGGTTKGTANLGFGVGAFFAYNFTTHMGVQLEGIYSSFSQKYSEKDVEREVTLKYFNIPLLFSLNTGISKLVNLNLVVGPQMGVSVGSRIQSKGSGDSTLIDPVLAVRKGDVGFAYGAGIDFGLNEKRTIRLSLGYRGVFGLFDISDNSRTKSTDNYYVLDRTKIKTNAAYAGLSIRF